MSDEIEKPIDISILVNNRNPDPFNSKVKEINASLLEDSKKGGYSFGYVQVYLSEPLFSQIGTHYQNAGYQVLSGPMAALGGQCLKICYDSSFLSKRIAKEISR
jgi:hypothetical protein